MRTTRLVAPIAFSIVLAGCRNQLPSQSLPPVTTPPPLPTPSDTVLYTSLDGVGAVMTPALGSGVGAVISTSPSNDFVPARIGNGLRTDAIGERIEYRQLAGGVQNVELDRGTIEFWYRPNYNHDDSNKYTITGTGNWINTVVSPGSLHLGKHNNSNQNAIFLIFYDANGVRWEHNVAVTSYSWRAGDWLLVRLTWDFGVAAGERNLHLYVNGAELPLTGEVSRGPQPVPAEKASELIYIGSRDLTGNIIPNGLYDEFRIWKRAIAP